MLFILCSTFVLNVYCCCVSIKHKTGSLKRLTETTVAAYHTVNSLHLCYTVTLVSWRAATVMVIVTLTTAVSTAHILKGTQWHCATQHTASLLCLACLRWSCSFNFELTVLLINKVMFIATYCLHNSRHDADGYESDDLFGDAPLSNTKSVNLKAAKVRVGCRYL
jgi:hypothetical protein